MDTSDGLQLTTLFPTVRRSILCVARTACKYLAACFARSISFRMNIYQTLYFMSLAGGTAGLLAWATQALLILLIPAGSPTWPTAVLAAALLGGFIGGFTVAFDEKWVGNRVQARWVAMGVLIGLLAGMLSGAVHLPLRDALPGALPLGTVLGWMVSGALIGAGLGARWISVNRARLAHGLFEFEPRRHSGRHRRRHGPGHFVGDVDSG